MVYCGLLCFLLLLYSYVGFPLLVSLIASLRPRTWKIDEKFEPTVSIIIAAHNEGLLIRRCIDSLLNLNYPLNKIEILCGSDGSTDLTNSVLQEYTEKVHNLRCFFYPQQRGKMLTLNDLVPEAKNEILLFVDADIALTPNSLLDYVRHYADPLVGGVAGRLAIEGEWKDGVFRSESAFLSFESNVRRSEARVSSSVGLNGANYTMRRELWTRLPDGRVHDDLYSVLSIIHNKKRVLYEENAVATEIYGRSFTDEFKRKSRSASRCFYTLSYFPHILFKSPVAWMLWPHKILRFLTSFLVLGVAVGSIVSYSNGSIIAAWCLTIETIMVLVVGVGWMGRVIKKSVPFASELYWFFQMNVAFCAGVLQFIFQTEKSTWSQTAQPSRSTIALATKKMAAQSEEAVHP